MDYKIIVLDLDGTLTNRDKIITPKTKEALMNAQENGLIVVLASGRPTFGVMPLAQELQLEQFGGYILYYNVRDIYNCQTGETVFSRLLPLEVNSRLCALAEEYGVNILTYEGDKLITPNTADIYSQKEAFINKLSLKEVPDFAEHMTFQVPKFLFMDDGDYLETVEPKVKAALGKNFSVYRSEPFFLEILPKGIDKAQSLARLLDLLHMNQSQMIACGDGYNDLTMIQFAGLGVAMENAVLPVRNAADYITLSNNDDGIAHVIEKFIKL